MEMLLEIRWNWRSCASSMIRTQIFRYATSLSETNRVIKIENINEKKEFINSYLVIIDTSSRFIARFIIDTRIEIYFAGERRI